ncbi:HEPN domain-containing protein [Komagataeibacter saccharivorans]|uniref:HEPN domain-containing protein n=1 Tax=Komagataeibacter saccharivorans TaxID=265959 RepID=UPI0011AF8495|nr:HEPN domain-containing protein [Komagataeibacter saccharivorans]
MIIKFENELRRDVKTFLNSVSGLVYTGEERFLELFSKSLSPTSPVRSFSGGFIELTPNLHEASEGIISRICQLIGPALASRSRVESIIFTEVVNKYNDNLTDEESLINIIEKIQTEIDESRRYIDKNELVRFIGDVSSFSLGPVSVKADHLLKEELTKSDAEYIINTHNNRSETTENNVFTLSKINWDISIYASHENIKEESLWISGIFTSILYLSCKSSLGIMSCVDVNGMPELSSFSPSITTETGIIDGKDNIYKYQSKFPVFYSIDKNIKDYFSNPKTKEFIEKIFYPNKNSLGMRLRQCLGWLAKGRQSQNRNESFLFFFTALESLLTSSDKTAPVVQNIARNAASILSDDVAQRSRYAKQIKSLYSIRSALIHSGERSVNRDHANDLQRIVHQVCERVLLYADIDSRISSFHDLLHISSYGLPWMEKYERNIPDPPMFNI